MGPQSAESESWKTSGTSIFFICGEYTKQAVRIGRCWRLFRAMVGSVQTVYKENDMSKGTCVFGDGPYVYYEEFRQAVELACPANNDLHILLRQSLENTNLSDMNIYFVGNQLQQTRKELLSDKQILHLQLSGRYVAVITELRRRVALQDALRLLSLGCAYGPPRS